MTDRPLSRSHRYGVAVLLVAIALILMLVLDPWAQMTKAPFLIFFGALTISAWYGGKGAGILTTLLSAVVANYFFIGPARVFVLDPRTVIFLVQGFLISYLCGSLRTAQERTRRSLQQLQANETQFRRLVNSNIIGVIACDTRGAITDANDEFLRMTGFSQEEVRSGRVRWDEITPADLKHLDEPALEELITQGKNTPYEKAFIGKGGNRVPVVVGAALLGDGSDRAVSFVLDLTQLRQTEQQLALQYRVTRVLSEAMSLESTLPTLLQTLCDTLGWQVAMVWGVDQQLGHLRCLAHWHGESIEGNTLVSPNRETTFVPGIGLPGRVWAMGQPLWVMDLASEPTFTRGELATQMGLHTVMGFPILLEDEVLGVIECFSAQPQPPNEQLLQLMTAIGSQIGQFLERKHTEIALQESQELFRNFMNNSPTQAFVKDGAGRFVFVNREIEQIYDRPLADWVGKTDFDFFTPKLAQQWRENDLRVLETGQMFRFTETGVLRDGTHHFISFKFPLCNSQGQQLVGGIAIDITDRIRAEQALQESEERYRFIFEYTGVSIWEEDFSQVYALVQTLKAQGVEDLRAYLHAHPEVVQQAIHSVQVRDVNHQALVMFGATDKAELLNSLENIFLPETNQTFVEEMVALAEDRRFYAGETVLRTLAGEKRHTLFTITFPPPELGYSRVLACITDITDRKLAEAALRQSEGRLSLALKSAPISLFHQDRDLRYTWIYNPTFDYAPSEVVGKRDQDLLSPEDATQLTRIKQQVLDSGTTHRTETKLSVNGQDFYYDLTIDPLLNDGQEPLGITCAAVDITERKRVENALRERENRFSTLFNGMDDWVLVYHLMPDGQPGRFIEVNEQACRKLGYSREELMARSVVDIIGAPLDPAASLTKLATENHLVAESVHVTREGRRIPVEVSATLFTLNGLPTVQSICRDITDRKQAEEDLRKSERLYRAIGETINYGIWVCDPEGRNIYVSESFLQLVGMTQEQCSEYGWGDVLHPEDAERTLADWKVCAQSGDLWDREHRFRGVDGNWHPILARGVPVRDENGNTLYWAGINLDISRLKQTEEELRESEERFRLAARAVTGLVYDWNPKTQQVYRSEGLQQLIGVSIEDDPGTQEWWSERIHPDDLAVMWTVWEDLMAGRQNRYDLEYRVRHAEGHWVMVRDQGYLIRDGRGQVLRVVGSSSDITDRKQAELEREQLLAREQASREQAEAANRIKDEFLAVLSHELRSPLNPILGWTRLLRTRRFDPETTDKALETIERNARLQTQLIEDLLDVSRILRGKLMLNVCSLDLVSTIESAIETVQIAAEAKGISIQKRCGSEVELISGDPARLQQIVWNLLSNAIKFTPEGGQVTVEVEQTQSLTQIQVRDTGKGISPDFLPHVFEYFRQADSTTTRTFGGLGLGLAIVRHLTELHGGTVHADSPGENQGATFTVKLPRKPAAIAPTSNTPRFSVTSSLSNLRILVVDDEVDMRDLVTVVLTEYGAIVKEVASAEEALRALDQFKPNVLISDIGMPEVDGYDLVRQIRTRSTEDAQIPAIALTAYAGEFNQQKALAAGFQMHLAKPVEPEALVKAISDIRYNRGFKLQQIQQGPQIK